jgi:predicted CoA-binding protein
VSRKRVAVLGASSNRSKYGNKSVRAHLQQGWEVYPVNPRAEEIEGLKAYPSLKAIPVKLDRVTLYLPPALGIKALPEVAEAEPAEFYVNPGAESEKLVAEARRLGLDPILACSILAIGESPEELDD